MKWLHKITVSDMPSPNRFIAREHKLLYSGGDDEIKTAVPILQYPINSAITSPEPGSKVSGDRITVRGYAPARANRAGRSLKSKSRATAGHRGSRPPFSLHGGISPG